MRRLTTLLIALLTITVFTTKRSEAQFYSASTNLPVLATGSINAELSMTLNRNWSLHLEGSVNPWKIEQFRIQHLAVRPAIRWWTSESYRGWFMGAHFCGAYAHIGIPKWMDKKYEGVTMGVVWISVMLGPSIPAGILSLDLVPELTIWICGPASVTPALTARRS